MPSVSGNNAQSLVTGTLTDAQIKASPTTAVQILPPPGAGKCYIVAWSVWELDNRAGAYAYVGNPLMALCYGTTFVPASYEYLDAAQGAFADTSAVHLLGVFLAAGDGAGHAAWFADRSQAENKSLTVGALLGSDFTGGNAANTMKVTAAYQILTL